MTRLIYLATPYNHASAEVREERFLAACKIAAQLMMNGTFLFAPICHTHPIALAGDLPKGWEFWEAYDRRMLAACDELWIVKMPGWEESVGIAGEIEIAKAADKPIHYLPYPE